MTTRGERDFHSNLSEKAVGVSVFKNIKAEAMNYGEAAPANGADFTGLTGL